MRDAAQAAAMSDPELNRWFRRRWAESTNKPVLQAPAALADEALIVTGLALLQDWRRERAQSTTASC